MVNWSFLIVLMVGHASTMSVSPERPVPMAELTPVNPSETREILSGSRVYIVVDGGSALGTFKSYRADGRFYDVGEFTRQMGTYTINDRGVCITLEFPPGYTCQRLLRSSDGRLFMKYEEHPYPFPVKVVK